MTVTVDTGPAHTVSIAQGDDVTVTVTDTPTTVTVDLTPSPAVVIEQAPVHQVTVATTGIQGAQGPAGPSGVSGPAGPQGPTGPPGNAAQQDFVFASPATTWIATHTIPIVPSVIAFDTSGDPIEGDVSYPTPTTVRITWAFPMAGSLTLTS